MNVDLRDYASRYYAKTKVNKKQKIILKIKYKIGTLAFEQNMLL